MLNHILILIPHGHGKVLFYGRDLIVKFISWNVGDGESITLLHNRWIPYMDKPLSHFIPFAGSDSLKVSFLLRSTPAGPSWDLNRISNIIPSFIISKILGNWC